MFALCRARLLQEVPLSLGSRWTSSIVRRRRRALFKAMADSSTHPAKVQRLREKSARPAVDTLRYIFETKVARVQTQEDRKRLWYDLRYNRYAPSFLGQIKPQMKLWTAALHESQLPVARLPEVAVCGRSNSGKSTLVNYLCGRHSANVRRIPGSTTELVFWKVGRPAQLCLVDLPGYGFAEAPEEKRLQWTEFTLWYIRARKNLRRVLLLIDGRQGLKPSDREMISYLERHDVAWQVVVTKCDKVVGKQLAKRLTIMKEDLSQFRKMAADPLPVSALKRHGMEALRDVLSDMKVAKEFVKDGIRRRVYDMLEQKRLRNAERRKRRKERKAEEAANPKPVDEAHEKEEEDEGIESKDLHEILGTWGPSPKVPAQEAPTEVRKVHVPDDRNTQRVDAFMASLFPDFSEMRAGASASASRSSGAEFSQYNLAGASAGQFEVHLEEEGRLLSVPADEGEAIEEDSESESDEEMDSVKPEVRHFEIKSDQGQGRQGLRPGQPVKTTKPSKIELFPGQDSRVSLRRVRPQKDQLYSEDDVLSPADYAAGFRRWAPSAPSPEQPGLFMAEARRRYEREWATELEDVDYARGGAPDALKPKKEKVREDAQEKRVRMPFITHKGDKPILPGHGKWRVLGRPPSKILKAKRTMDAAKALNVKSRYKRKRNLGSGLEWDEAKEKWANWYQKNRKSNWDRVQEASSPKKEDVEAAFESHQERRRKRMAQTRQGMRHSGGRAREVNKPRDEAAMPDWAEK
ncbi:unnamed protein product [Effrenium voratum]|uniref:EngB-type G domain-containing protein n=2 Tax=Effrenium voratum TaxID=2562239 RepID=A0AA36NBB4_9DINO|nr:unnamed protein product [Effrenium voratum]CAJ1435095.1 unnamed protein product [Effrenium voratum]